MRAKFLNRTKNIVVVVSLMLGITVTLSPASNAAGDQFPGWNHRGTSLPMFGTLNIKDYIGNDTYQLRMQPDRNLVLYKIRVKKC